LLIYSLCRRPAPSSRAFRSPTSTSLSGPSPSLSHPRLTRCTTDTGMVQTGRQGLWPALPLHHPRLGRLARQTLARDGPARQLVGRRARRLLLGRPEGRHLRHRVRLSLTSLSPCLSFAWLTSTSDFARLLSTDTLDDPASAQSRHSSPPPSSPTISGSTLPAPYERPDRMGGNRTSGCVPCSHAGACLATRWRLDPTGRSGLVDEK